ncbi:MAG: hypothetical protein HY089_06205 [Ignavibacteriales bacterium]|nr:hypothetical protein [Ignavibacteriales bacterium]
MHYKNVTFAFFLLVLLIAAQTTSFAQQVADTLFAPTVGAPAYKEGAGPVVLLDEAHHNFHTPYPAGTVFAVCTSVTQRRLYCKATEQKVHAD